MITFGDLFAGIGGFSLGFERAGMECNWHVEIEPYCQKVLRKHWPNCGEWDDVRTFPPSPAEDWYVDVICGGFPCQDISNAGKRAGIDGERSGLWREMLRVVREIRPRIVVVENVAALLGRGIDRVLGALAESGYDAEWDVFPACAFGAPHSRERLFLIAHSDEIGWRSRGNRMPDGARSNHWEASQGKCEWEDMERWIRETFSDCYGTATASELKRVDEWFPARLDRIGSCGNAVVPQVAEFIGRRIVDALSGAGQ